MCGIAGIKLNATGRTKDVRELEQTMAGMLLTIASRGPDAGGYEPLQSIILGHARLKILELSDAGAQPMATPNKKVWIVFNGEIYNHKELRKKIDKKRDVVWRGASDTEVILNLYEAFGVEGLELLEGIFAIALWDEVCGRLLLMRDRLGVKPLYYGEAHSGLAFGSQIGTVLAAGIINSGHDSQSLSEYLWFGNTFEDRTFYQGVKQLKPGHLLTVDDDGVHERAWWKVEDWLDLECTAGGRTEIMSGLQRRLDEAVDLQLVADVPVGLFLSGGLDSSAVAASAMAVRSTPLKSFAAGFDFEKGINELPKAAAVAEYLGLDHNELKIDSTDELISAIYKLADAHGEPFADAANIALYLMCRQMGTQFKVVLQGDGGDELFGGYRRYALLRNLFWWKMIPKWLSNGAKKFGSHGVRLARLADASNSPDAHMRMSLLMTMERFDDRPENVFEPEYRDTLLEETDPFLAYWNSARRFEGKSPAELMMLTDLTQQLPSQFLTKVDRASMAAGMEARVPLLDERVLKFALNIPVDMKVRGVGKKIILRESQRSRLPGKILDAPKTGFGVPYGFWMREKLSEFTRDNVLDSGFLRKFNFERSEIEKLFGGLAAGDGRAEFMLWKLLQLSIWDATNQGRY